MALLAKRYVEQEMYFGRRHEIVIENVDLLEGFLQWTEDEYRRAEEAFYVQTGHSIIDYATNFIYLEDNNE